MLTRYRTECCEHLLLYCHMYTNIARVAKMLPLSSNPHIICNRTAKDTENIEKCLQKLSLSAAGASQSASHSASRSDRLKEILGSASKKHTLHIMKELSLKGAHAYCVTERLSAQRFGPLIEQYIIEKFRFTKNSASECIGDCSKHNEQYEIKVSLGGANHDRFNYVQIRVSHPVTYYILTAYHLSHTNVENEGELYVFKVPKECMKTLILNHGSYAHGTLKEHSQITRESLDDITNKKEYALRTRIGDACWKSLIPYMIHEAEL